MNAHVVNIDDGVDHHCLKEQFEDTKEVIKSRKTKKNRKYNDIKKQGINRPAVENQKMKCNEPMGYTPISYVIGKRNDDTLRIAMP